MSLWRRLFDESSNRTDDKPSIRSASATSVNIGLPEVSSPPTTGLDAQLIEAIRAGDREETESVLVAGANPEARDSEGRTALLIAASLGYQSLIEALIRLGAHQDAQDSRNGRTALHLASMNGHIAAVGCLLERGLEKDAVDFRGYSALQWALFNEREEIAKLLREAGAAEKLIALVNHKVLFTGGGYANGSGAVTFLNMQPYLVKFANGLTGEPYCLYKLDPERIRCDPTDHYDKIGLRHMYRYLDDLNESDRILVTNERICVVTGLLPLPDLQEPSLPESDSCIVTLDPRYMTLIAAAKPMLRMIRRLDIVFDDGATLCGVSFLSNNSVLLPSEYCDRTIASVSVPRNQDLQVRVESYVRIRAGAPLRFYSAVRRTTSKDEVLQVLGYNPAENQIYVRGYLADGNRVALNAAAGDVVSVVRY